MKYRLSALLTMFVSLHSALATDQNFSEQDTVITTSDGVKLAAKWALPKNSAPSTVALLLQGSGNVGLDGDVSSPFVGTGYKGASAKLSNELAETLASIGIASLRYSKRGFEDATQLPNQTIPYLVRDAQSAVELIKNQYPKAKLVIVGFSEGALVASLVASEKKNIDALYLIAPPTRSIDEIAQYQFREWPLNLVRNKLDTNRDGELGLAELAVLGDRGGFPLINLTAPNVTWHDIDENKNGNISIEKELVPAYEKTLQTIMAFMKSPALNAWYESMKAVPAFKEIAGKIHAPVYLYQATADSQVNPEWIKTDEHYFSGPTTLKYFEDLSHCFSPMDGAYGEVKTSGPFDKSLLESLSKDLVH